jgi:hypothetical protein
MEHGLRRPLMQLDRVTVAGPISFNEIGPLLFLYL